MCSKSVSTSTSKGYLPRFFHQYSDALRYAEELVKGQNPFDDVPIQPV